MADPISTFFSAWQLESSEERLATVTSAVTTDVAYDDPRTPDTVSGAAALSDYVGMFSANAPGWSARVVKADTMAGVTRATIAFGGPGPDGAEVEQLGQYFVEMEDDRIARMVGFVGTGAPE